MKLRWNDVRRRRIKSKKCGSPLYGSTSGYFTQRRTQSYPMLVPYGRELCDIPYVFLKTTSSMSDRPKALKGMLVGKTKNDEMTLSSIQKNHKLEYYTQKEMAGIISILIKNGRVKRLS